MGDQAASGANAQTKSSRGSSMGEEDEDARTRAEFRDAFASEDLGRQDKTPKGVKVGPAKSGPDLLKELQSLRDDAEALEARMAARIANRQAAEGGGGENEASKGAASK